MDYQLAAELAFTQHSCQCFECRGAERVVERRLVEIFGRLVRRRSTKRWSYQKSKSADRVQPLPTTHFARAGPLGDIRPTPGQDTKDARASKRFSLPHVPCISTHAHVAARISIARRCNNKQHPPRESHDMAVVAMSTECKLHATGPVRDIRD